MNTDGATHQPLLPSIGPGDTLLAVWAHPDDESLLGAGLMLEAARAGARVVNVSATLGELGTDDPSWTPERLGRHRHVELTCALAHLGGADLELLGIRDGSCEHLSDHIGTGRMSALVDRYRPDAVLTFDIDGVTGHPDHQAISRWTRRAVANVSPDTPLLAAITVEAWSSDLIERMHDVGAFFPGYPERRPSSMDRHYRVTGHDLDRKLAALESHDSQIWPLHDCLGANNYRELVSHEAYRPLNTAAVAAVGFDATQTLALAV